MARRRRKSRRKSGFGKKFVFLIGLALLVAGFLTRRMIVQHPPESMPSIPAARLGGPSQSEPAPVNSARMAENSSAAADQASAPSAAASGRARRSSAGENLTNDDRHALDDLLRQNSR
jgi:hypothetical protein